MSCDGDRKIDIYNYECKRTNENTWMVHYITISDNKNYFRTSIWVMEENLKLIFHQASILSKEATQLSYYLQSRIEIEKIFRNKDYRPKRWSNYRPLWYKYFSGEELPENSYGQQEKI